jgi:hypothetical protein
VDSVRGVGARQRVVGPQSSDVLLQVRQDDRGGTAPGRAAGSQIDSSRDV